MPLGRWSHILSKLRTADRGELWFRARQEAAKRYDTVLSRIGYDFTPGIDRSSLRTRRFFFDADSVERVTALLRERMPGQVAQIIEQAERVCRHRFDLLGYEDLDYGESINWHLDVVHGKQAPKKPSYKIRYLDFQEVGDSKVTWELNRHQHFVTLAKAYRLTGNRQYGEEISRQWSHWHAENPYPIGINWASSLEVAFRAISWCWVFYLLEGTPILSSDLQREWLRAQAINGRHIERYLSTYFSPNTHLLGEAVALFFIGTLIPQLSRAKHWQSMGRKIIVHEASRQVLPDGFHFERSTYYHVYALDFFLHAAILAGINEDKVNGDQLSTELEHALKQMLHALLVLGRAGNPPRFGDDDGGRLFDPKRNRDEHLLDPLATGAVLFGDGNLKHAAGELREETIWLTGENGVAAWDEIEAKPPQLDSRALDSAGIYALPARNSCSQWVIKSGIQDRDNAAHGHADALSVCFQSQGRVVLMDPGTFEYVGPGTERDRFRGTAMHNTLRVDDTDQSEPAGPFAWNYLAQAQVEKWIQGETFDLLIASHNGYSRLTPPLLHYRYFLSLKAGVLLVRDVVLGQGTHQLDISWHLAPEMQSSGDHRFSLPDAGSGLGILPVESHGWSEQIRSGSYSSCYGRQESAKILNFGTRTEVPAEFVTMLVPLESRATFAGRLTRSEWQAPGRAAAYLYETETEQYSFYFGESGKPWKLGTAASDAECICLGRRKGDSGQRIILCNGSYLEIDGRRVFDFPQVVTSRELGLPDE